jgi:hypothetical protein
VKGGSDTQLKKLMYDTVSNNRSQRNGFQVNPVGESQSSSCACVPILCYSVRSQSPSIRCVDVTRELSETFDRETKVFISWVSATITDLAACSLQFVLPRSYTQLNQAETKKRFSFHFPIPKLHLVSASCRMSASTKRKFTCTHTHTHRTILQIHPGLPQSHSASPPAHSSARTEGVGNCPGLERLVSFA